MKTRSHSLPLKARSRLHVARSDPIFTGAPEKKTTIRVVPAFPDDDTATAANSPLWRQEVVDRLKTPLTRYHE